MRVWLSGPRIVGIRPGISLSLSDLRTVRGALARRPVAYALLILAALAVAEADGNHEAGIARGDRGAQGG
jgi:hypothetical protein